MSQKYEAVMGLEVHVELNTKSKMFCSCSADYFGKEPNTHTCPVCLGLPGATPYTNIKAIEDCMKIGLALGCTVSSKKSLFERKNYFYPDLAKGYQISQLRWPLCVNGSIEVENSNGEMRVIRINRAHQEEDTGKLTHAGGESFIDYNRSSVPLVEIVTEPDFKDTAEIRDYAKKLQQLFRYLGVSNADMERGDMRLEANISVRPVGQVELPPYRVELKNINSFRFMVAAVEFEIKRQIEALDKGEKLHQETRGWDEDKKQTYLQRSKEEANDYRYFPEPDIPEMQLDAEFVSEIKANLPELPWQKVTRYVTDYGINLNVSRVLCESIEKAQFFEDLLILIKDSEISASEVANFIANRDIGQKSPEEIIAEMKERKTGVIDSEDELKKVIDEAIAENPKSVEDFKMGKTNALQALLGVVMRKTKGKADPVKTTALLQSLLG